MRKTGVVAKSLIVATVAAGLTMLAVGPAGATTVDPTLKYTYTGQEQQITVPADTTSIRVTMIGGKGDSCGSSAAEVAGTLAVRPGQVLTIAVGGDGAADGGNKAPGNGGWSTTDPNHDYSGGRGGSGHGADTQDGSGGGGATVLKIDGRTVMVAGGSGGQGGTARLDASPHCGGASGSIAAINGEAPGSDGDLAQGKTGGEGGSANNSDLDKTGGSETGGLLSGGGGGGGGGYHNGGGGTKSIHGGGGGGGGSSWADATLTSNVTYGGSNGSAAEVELSRS